MFTFLQSMIDRRARLRVSTTSNRFGQCLVPIGLVMASLFLSSTVSAQDGISLDGVSYSTLPGERVQIELTLSGKADEPLRFAIDNPARIALDFPGVSLNLPKKTTVVGTGMARSVTAVQAAGRTRVVLNLIKLVPYTLKTEGNSILITLESAGASGSAAFADTVAVSDAQGGSIRNVDFRRGLEGEGRILVSLSDPSTVIDTFEEGGKIVVDFTNTSLPERLSRRLDVIDFATPVSTIDTVSNGNNVRMEIEANGLFEHLAYQSGDLFTIDVKAVSKAEQETARKEKFGSTGERLSLNFQSIEVRSVLQLIADFTGLNLVTSDTVVGNLTLRLKNVPWDQALDIILRTRGLAMRQTGNVMLVAPSEEIAARERLELESRQQIVELAPLRSEFIQINYASAGDLAGLLQTEDNSLLSARGQVSVDARTNTLLIRDTVEALNSVRRLVAKLDVPVRQVLIESRIVVADDTFSRALGVNFGVSVRDETGPVGTPNHLLTVGGGLAGDTTFPGTVSFNEGGVENYLVSLPIGGPAGAIKAALVAIPDVLLQLELQALQSEGRGEVLSNPRVVTSNQTQATISSGTQIPSQEASSSGASTVSFQDATLSLVVTPQITPDDRIIMDLSVNKDSIGTVFNGAPSINTQSVTTQVLVNNGETVVLGGIFEQTKSDSIAKVPFFGDLPYVGFLFRNRTVIDNKSELLIFVTPKILNDVVAGN